MLMMSAVITIYMQTGVPRPRVTLGSLKKLAVPELLWKNVIDRALTSIHPAERNTDLYPSLLVPILLVQYDRSAAEKNEASYIRH